MKEEFNVYIMAGGKSSRMGTDKGLMEFNNRPLVSYVLETFKPVAHRTLLVGASEDYSKFGVEIIPDLHADLGPAGGILTALSHSNRKWNFIAACDMPFIDIELVNKLMLSAQGADIIVPVTENGWEPLCAVYSKDILPIWEQQLSAGVLKLQNIIQNCNFQLIKMERVQDDLYRPFTNLNTPEELRQTEKQNPK